MLNKNNLYKYIGKSKVAFENGRIYEAKPVKDGPWNFMSIKDESGEWYNYGMKFFEENFVEV